MSKTAVQSGEGTFEGSGGLKLFFRSWRPEGKARGVVVIVPGFNAHSGFYTWAGEQLADSGLATYAVDLRGRGRSDANPALLFFFSATAPGASSLFFTPPRINRSSPD